MTQREVLYIEDNFHNRRVVKKILQSQGINLIEAADGLYGLEVLQSKKPPLVLLDIALPGLDGLKLVSRAKADPEVQHIPVIALTASAMEGDRERFIEAGCDDYIAKPFRASELLQMVEDYYPTG